MISQSTSCSWRIKTHMQTSKEYEARAWILEDLRQHLTTNERDEVVFLHDLQDIWMLMLNPPMLALDILI